MDYDTMKLIVKCQPQFQSVLPDSVDAYKDIAAQCVCIVACVERHDVCKGVMIEILDVDLS